MIKTVIALALITTGIQAQVPVQPPLAAVGSANQVVQWNRNLLSVVRTPGAQPATIHPTRSFAIMHAAIYDAVNSIDRTHHRYLVQVEGVSGHASQAAAAASAAHEVLVALYPKFEATLDSELEESLGPIPDGPNKEQGITIGRLVADEIVALRSNDGSSA